MKDPDHTQALRGFLVVDSDRLEALHRPRPEAWNRSVEWTADPRMPLELFDARDYGFSPYGVPRRVFLCHLVSLGAKAVPVAIVSLDGFTGMKTLQ